MPYVIPTPADIKIAYEEFAGVADARIQTEIGLAGLAVDQSWPEAAFTPAYMLYVANALRAAGLGSVVGASGSADQGGSNVKRRRAGDHEIEFFDASSSEGGGGAAAFYAASFYGDQFRMLQRRYFGGPRVF